MAGPVQHTLPYGWYSDPEILRREQERIFRPAWQYAGHLGEVPEPGTFLATRAGHVPIVITRARDGELRALLNVCRHRGFPLAEGRGQRETLQCPYHAWTYDLDGSLRAAPRSEEEPDFPQRELGLVPAAVDTWGPFVFVNALPEPEPLADALGSMPAQVAELGLDVGGLVFHSRWETELDANWKIACENFLECYHCQVAHPQFSELVDVSPLGVNIFPGRPNLSIGPIVPLAPERTYRFLDYFFGPDVDQAWIEELLAFDDQVGREDRLLVEGAHRGVASGALEHGYLLGRSEQLIAHFQQLTAAALQN